MSISELFDISVGRTEMSGSSLVRLMTDRLFVAKPLPGPNQIFFFDGNTFENKMVTTLSLPPRCIYTQITYLFLNFNGATVEV